MNSKRHVNGKLGHVVQIRVCRFCLTSLIRSQIQVVFSNLVESLSSWHLKVTDRWKKKLNREGWVQKKIQARANYPNKCVHSKQRTNSSVRGSSPYQGIFFMPVGVKTSIVFTKVLPLLLCRADVHDMNDILFRISLGESWCGRVLFNVKLREVSTCDKFFN